MSQVWIGHQKMTITTKKVTFGNNLNFFGKIHQGNILLLSGAFGHNKTIQTALQIFENFTGFKVKCYVSNLSGFESL